MSIYPIWTNEYFDGPHVYIECQDSSKQWWPTWYPLRDMLKGDLDHCIWRWTSGELFNPLTYGDQPCSPG